MSNVKEMTLNILFKFQYGATNIFIYLYIPHTEPKFKFQYGATNITLES